MLVSTKGRYALRVLVDMAEHQSNEYLPLKDIAKRQDISEKYLESIVKELVKGGVLIGLRGKGGGYRLGKAPDQINVGDVLEIMEGTFAPVSCLEESEVACPRMAQCRTLTFWRGLDEVIDKYIHGYSIADLTWLNQPGNDYVI